MQSFVCVLEFFKLYIFHFIPNSCMEGYFFFPMTMRDSGVCSAFCLKMAPAPCDADVGETENGLMEFPAGKNVSAGHEWLKPLQS